MGVYLWREEVGSWKETGRKGKREGQEPRLLANLGKRSGGQAALLEATGAATVKQFLEIYSFFCLLPPSPFCFSKNVDQTL